MNILYNILMHVVWRVRLYNYFREIFKFRNFMNTLRNFAKSVFAHMFAKFKYLSKAISAFYSVKLRTSNGSIFTKKIPFGSQVSIANLD